MEHIVPPAHQTVIIFTTDPSTAHILTPLVEGPVDALFIMEGPQHPIFTLCGSGFLPNQISEVGPAIIATSPTCIPCSDAL
jgi:hypothetical protein